MSKLRPYQVAIKQAIFEGWQTGARNILAEAPTGSGKTVIMADVIKTLASPCAAIAHRSELVTQISMSLAREGVRHRVIGSDTTRKACIAQQMDELNRSFYDPSALVGVCSIDTLVGLNDADPWLPQVRGLLMDEAHHTLKDNKWGKGWAKFPNAYGLGFSAMAWRGDGKGLGSKSHGVFDLLVKGPGGRDMINAGYLTDYKVFSIPYKTDYDSVNVTAGGDYSPVKLAAAVHADDQIVGDVVKHYRRICMEKLGRLGLGVTFAVDVESAKEIAEAFRADGVPAEVVTANTHPTARRDILKRFARREILQLVNVDLFGEGFDLPAIEVVSMVRKTESLQLYVQQFGRALRLMISKELQARWGELTDEQRLHFISISEKPFAIIIDHVGNVLRHGVPDAPRLTSLDPRVSRNTTASDAIPTRVCTNTNVGGRGETCGKDYPRNLKCCPYCQYVEPIAERGKPEHVDGDLSELPFEVLEAMRGKVIDLNAVQNVPPGPAGVFATARIHDRKVAQHALRNTMALWAGWQRHLGRSDAEAMKTFYLQYGIDILTAQSLGAADAEALAARIQGHLNQHGVVAA